MIGVGLGLGVYANTYMGVPSLLIPPAVLAGAPLAGQTMLADPGAWTDATLYEYQWTRDGVDIPGATSQTYAAVAADETAVIRVRVTASGPGGVAAAQTSAGVRLWLPTDAADLRCWWDPAAPGALTEVDGRISVVANRVSGQPDLEQATAANRPIASTLGGRVSVHHDDRTRRMTFGNVGVASDNEWEFAWAQGETQVAQDLSFQVGGLIQVGTQTAGARTCVALWYEDTRAIERSTATTRFFEPETYYPADGSVSSFAHAGNNHPNGLRLWINAGDALTVIGGAIAFAATDTNGNSTGLVANQTAGSAARRNIGCIALWNRQLTDAERAKVQGYQAHYWGLAGKLPALHAYKASPPVVEVA